MARARATAVALLLAATVVSGSYVDPATDETRYEPCIPGDADAGCGAQRVCEPLATDDVDVYVCLHKSLRSFTAHDAGCGAAVFVCTVLAAAAGCGGGGLYVPILLMIGGFLFQEALPLAHAAVLGNAFAQTLLNSRTRHAGKPVIDYATPLFVLPPMLAGHALGGLLKHVLPPHMMSLVALVVLGYALYKMFLQARMYSAGHAQWDLPSDGGRARIADGADPLAGPGGEDEEMMGTVNFSNIPSPRNPIASVANSADGDVESLSGTRGGVNFGNPRGSRRLTPSGSLGLLLSTGSRPHVKDSRLIDPLMDATPAVGAAAIAGTGNTTPAMDNLPEPMARALDVADPDTAPQVSPMSHIVAMGVFWVFFTGVFTGMKSVATCSGEYWGLYAALFVVVVGFAFLNAACLNHATPGVRFLLGMEKPKRHLLPHSPLVLRVLAAGVGLGTGLLGLGGGELMISLLLEFGMPPEVAAATAAYCITWTSSSDVVQHLITWNWFFIDGMYLAYFAFIAVLGAIVGRVAGARVQSKHRSTVPYVMCLFFLVAMGLFAGAMFHGDRGADSGDDVWWPPRSPCRYTAAPTEYEIAGSQETAVKALAAQLGIPEETVALLPGLSSGQGEGVSKLVFETAHDGAQAVRYNPAAFHANATIMGAPRKLEVVQLQGTTSLRVHLAGNYTAAQASVLTRATRAAFPADADRDYASATAATSPPVSAAAGASATTAVTSSSSSEDCFRLNSFIDAFPEEHADVFVFCNAALDVDLSSDAMGEITLRGVVRIEHEMLESLAGLFNLPEEGFTIEAPIPVAAGVKLANFRLHLDAEGLTIHAAAPAYASLGDGFWVENAVIDLTVTPPVPDAAAPARGYAELNTTTPPGGWVLAAAARATAVLDLGSAGKPFATDCAVVYSPASGALELSAVARETYLTLGALTVDVDRVELFGEIAVGKGALASANVSVAAEVRTAGATIRLAGEIVAGGSDIGILGEVQDLSMSNIFDVVASVGSGSAAAHREEYYEEYAEPPPPMVLEKASALARTIEFEYVLLGFATSDMEVDNTGLAQGAQLVVRFGINGFRCEAVGNITRDGVVFHGRLLEVNYDALGPVGEHIEIDELEATFMISEERGTRFEVKGGVTMFSMDLDMMLAFTKAPAGMGTGVEALVYLHAEPEGERVFSLASPFPVLKGTPAEEIGFRSLTFIYSSTGLEGIPEIPHLADVPITPGFSLKANVSAWATIKKLLVDTAKEELPDLLLDAVLPSVFGGGGGGRDAATLGFAFPTPSISISLPKSLALDLGDHCTAEPPFIEFALFGATPGVKLAFPMAVRPPGQDSELEFEAGLSLDLVGASGYGRMDGYWEEPFGANGLKIGPSVGMELGIIYAQFVTTGLPSAFGLTGSLELGAIAGELSIRISADPSENVLMGRLYRRSDGIVDKLAAIVPGDLVDAFSSLVQISVPADAVPALFKLYNLDLNIAPVAGELAGVKYPQGVSFTADMEIYGSRLTVDARVNADGFRFHGEVEPFAIGPLRITGVTQQNAIVSVEISSAAQHVLVDGAVGLFGAELGAVVRVAGPDDVEFRAYLDFGPALQFEVLGSKTSEGFYLRAHIETDIVNYVQQAIVKSLLKIEAEFDNAVMHIDAKEKEYRALFDPAYAKLESTRAVAAALRERLVGNLKAKQQEFFDNVVAKKMEMEAKAEEFVSRLADAQARVKEFQGKFDAEMQEAQAKLEHARRAYRAKVGHAEAAVARARVELVKRFDKAEQKIKGADDEYHRAIAKAKEAEVACNACKWYRVDCKARHCPMVPAFYTQAGVCKAAYETARLVLQGSEVASAQGALRLAEEIVDKLGESTEKIAFDTAERVLRDVRAGTNVVLLKVAEADLEEIGPALEKYTPYGVAAQALGVVEREGRAAVDALTDELNKFGETAEQMAFVAAQQALEAVEEGTVAVSFKAAKLAVSTSRDFVRRIADDGDRAFRVEKFEMVALLSNSFSPTAFNVTVDAALFGQDVNFELTWTPDTGARGNATVNGQSGQDFVGGLLADVVAKGEEVVGQLASR